MQFKWLLFFSALAVANAASIFRGEIPVKVIYDEEVTHRLYVRNLDKTTQEELQNLVSPVNEIKPTPEREKTETTSNAYNNALDNHSEKLQLSPEELPLAIRHLPFESEEQKIKEEDGSKQLKIVTPPETPDAKPADLEEDNKLFLTIQEIIHNGVQRIKDDVKTAQHVVQPEVWKTFNDSTNDFLQSVSKNSLRQSANSSGIIDQFQIFARNVVKQLSGQKQTTSGTQQPGFPQNIAQLFTNGLNQIQQGLAATFSGQQQQPATVLGDSPSTPAPNPIQGLVQQAQNTFSNFFNPQQQNPADQSSSPNPIQSFSNSIGQALQGLNPFNNRPGTVGDESSTQGGPLQIFQNALSNLNPFQQTTAKPADTSSSNPLPSVPPITNPFGNNTAPNIPNVGQQITDAISNPAGAIGSLVGNNPLLSGNNPLSGVAQQISSAIPNNPLQTGNNPLQGVAQQISAAIPNNPLQSGNNPIESIAQQAGSIIPSNPLQSGNNPIQGVAQQLGNLVPNNPLQNGRK